MTQPSQANGPTSRAVPSDKPTPNQSKTPQQRGRMARTKGAGAERELAGLLSKLTGYPITRKVRNHRADSDLDGLPGYSIECKRHASAPRSTVARWWEQACTQAKDGSKPILFYREDRGPWLAVWSVNESSTPPYGLLFEQTCTGLPAAWCEWAITNYKLDDLLDRFSDEPVPTF